MAAAHPPAAPALLVVKVGGSCLEQLEPEWWDRLAELCRGGNGGASAGDHVRGGDARGDHVRGDHVRGDHVRGDHVRGDAASSAEPTKLVVVHGWSRMVSAETPEGQPDFIVDKHGFRSRYTTEAVLEQIVRVSGELRGRIADVLRERGLNVGEVEGADSDLLHAEVRQNMWWVGEELVPLTNLVGPVREVDRSRLDVLLAEHDAVVVTPLAKTPDHPRVNTDADRAAAAIAGAGGAERLVLVMDAEAVLADGEPVRQATRTELKGLSRHAKGGMTKKLRAVDEALGRGVSEVAIGRAPVPDLLAGRAGTRIVGDGPTEGAASAAGRLDTATCGQSSETSAGGSTSAESETSAGRSTTVECGQSFERSAGGSTSAESETSAGRSTTATCGQSSETVRDADEDAVDGAAAATPSDSAVEGGAHPAGVRNPGDG
jgi:[amino group carrier protein]-L-2-aminoadipate 6-kinase